MKPTVRIILFILVFVAVVVLPWWLSAFFLIALTIYMPYYIEVIFFGFLFDILYSPQFSFWHSGLAIATVVLLVTMFVKTRVRI